jgi:hypothetical protein
MEIPLLRDKHLTLKIAKVTILFNADPKGPQNTTDVETRFCGLRIIVPSGEMAG